MKQIKNYITFKKSDITTRKLELKLLKEKLKSRQNKPLKSYERN